ncbi:hypothetical protein BpHYR1_047229 [Brachionus plicatilis]|uniref:Uncharacterized protein n=1 Tax=Brachionus plicatilis TaxID=10195 RepID=A0A3M7T5S3_BRAPC|nr:hypothetical protein BpHYR1_047229 [Brachionus plicatilis]
MLPSTQTLPIRLVCRTPNLAVNKHKKWLHDKLALYLLPDSIKQHSFNRLSRIVGEKTEATQYITQLDSVKWTRADT